MDSQENQQVQQPQQEQKEVKEERIDELDVIGGLLLRSVQKGLNGIKNIFLPRKVE
jgi:hypothetical protein